jgi:hypothetical protein
MFIGGVETSRQHISLSEFAWDVINNDLLNFSADDAELPLAGLLNRVFLSFYQQADASIPLRLYEKENSLNEALKGMSEATRKEAVARIKASYQTELIEKISKGSEHYNAKRNSSITLQKKTISILERLREEKYYENKNGAKVTRGKFMSAVFEEYASKPYCQRELIYYSEMTDAIRQALESERALSFSYQGERRYRVLPFALQTDKLSMYNYLVCLNTSAGKPGDAGKPMAFRLSRLSEPEVDTRAKPGSGRLPAVEQTEIKTSLAKGDVSFLSDFGKKSEIRIRLTEKGKKMYNKIIHMRPRKVGEDGDIYLFDCTDQQIVNYFFKFGADAEILEPERLRKRFGNMYRQALNVYA